MASEPDVYMTAMLVTQRDPGCAVISAMNAGLPAKKGDRAGQVVRLRVIDADKMLEANVPAAGVAVQ